MLLVGIHCEPYFLISFCDLENELGKSIFSFYLHFYRNIKIEIRSFKTDLLKSQKLIKISSKQWCFN